VLRTQDYRPRIWLVIAACKFDDYVLNSFLKFRITDQTYVEVSGLTQPMRLFNDHHRVLSEGRDNTLNGIDWLQASKTFSFCGDNASSFVDLSHAINVRFTSVISVYVHLSPF
jgi:hypothetical protein